MSIHDGVVALADDKVDVIVGLDDETVRLSAGGTEIGEWPAAECTIDPAGDGVFVITAENESLQFIPRDPTTFVMAMNGGRVPEGEVSEEIPEDLDSARISAPSEESDAPKSVTMVLFYVLVGATALLGFWALANLIL